MLQILILIFKLLHAPFEHRVKIIAGKSTGLKALHLTKMKCIDGRRAFV